MKIFYERSMEIKVVALYSNEDLSCTKDMYDTKILFFQVKSSLLFLKFSTVLP